MKLSPALLQGTEEPSILYWCTRGMMWLNSEWIVQSTDAHENELAWRKEAFSMNMMQWSSHDTDQTWSIHSTYPTTHPVTNNGLGYITVRTTSQSKGTCTCRITLRTQRDNDLAWLGQIRTLWTFRLCGLDMDPFVHALRMRHDVDISSLPERTTWNRPIWRRPLGSEHMSTLWRMRSTWFVT